MADATLLNELCSICNINKFKYRCPGCAARTCSLPCYKRHQQWAQCSGQRDPTKFVKKSELVTAAGIDHDFNFLSGIDRNLEKAERIAGITTGEPPSDVKSKNQRPGVNYKRIEEAAGVHIVRAPQGLSRQKENKSHLSSTKRATRNVQWTVEWFDETKRRVLTETSSTHLIKDAQPFVQGSTDGKSKKRKLNTEAPIPNTSSHSLSPHQDEAPTSENQVERLQVDDAETEPASPGQGASTQDQEQHATKRQADMAEADPRDSRNDGPVPEPVGSGRHRIFLLRPRTSSSRHVLIPLNSSHTLAESLNGRTILEFPTLYVFPSSMTQLPEEYMLEEEYVKQEGEEQKEFDDLMKELDPDMLRRLREGEGEQRDRGGEEVDSSRILDVLKQDLGGGL